MRAREKVIRRAVPNRERSGWALGVEFQPQPARNILLHPPHGVGASDSAQRNPHARSESSERRSRAGWMGWNAPTPVPDQMGIGGRR